MENKLTIIADASLFKESACLLRTFLTAIKGYRARKNNNDIEFGTAVHKFKAHWRNNPSDIGFATAVMMAKQHYANADMYVKSNKKYLTTDFLVQACNGYASKYRDDNFEIVQLPHEVNFNGNIIKAGTPLIEPITRFAFPYRITPTIELFIAGTMDEIGKWRGGRYCISDLKTTSVWNSDEYFKSYDLSPQLLTYRWALKKYAEAYPDSFLAEIDKDDPGAVIDGVFYAGADKPIEYKRSKIFTFKDWALKEFQMLVDRKVDSFIAEVEFCIKNNVVPLREGILNGACTTPYGPCKFAEVCRMPDDESRMTVLENNFKIEPYNPLAFGE
jgi:hypothetical protein